MVYVSTAYSNERLDFIEERVYEPLLNLDLDWYVQCANALPSDIVVKIMETTQVRDIMV